MKKKVAYMVWGYFNAATLHLNQVRQNNLNLSRIQIFKLSSRGCYHISCQWLEVDTRLGGRTDQRRREILSFDNRQTQFRPFCLTKIQRHTLWRSFCQRQTQFCHFVWQTYRDKNNEEHFRYKDQSDEDHFVPQTYKDKHNQDHFVSQR